LDERSSPETSSHEQALGQWKPGEGCQRPRDVDLRHPQLYLAGIELLAEPCHLLEQRSWLETSAQRLLPSLHFPQDLGSPNRIHVGEGSAEKGRKAEAEDRPDVAVARAADDVFFQAANRFVDELKRAAFRHFLAIEALALPSMRQQGVY